MEYNWRWMLGLETLPALLYFSLRSWYRAALVADHERGI